MSEDASQYHSKRKFYESVLTIYGRKPVLEALDNPDLIFHRLHLAESNRQADILQTILELAEARCIEILYHDKRALSRISKNGKQDQGIALDIQMPGFQDYHSWLKTHTLTNQSFIALDGVTNPQNLGMIIRTVCASPITALILPRKGCARLDSLVIKASAGTLFRSAILWCDDLAECLATFQNQGAQVICLDARSPEQLFDYRTSASGVFVLGNESRGPRPAIQTLSNCKLSIPMQNHVESLNVAVAAGLVAFSIST